MTFTSVIFLIYFIIILLVLLLIQNIFRKDETKIRKYEHIVLLVGSYFFYGWCDWRFCFLLLILTIFSYFIAKKKQTSVKARNKVNLVVGVTIPLVILGFFKYYNFFICSFCEAFGIPNVGVLQILLPMGISFYTFKVLSYTIDVYNGKIEKEKSFIDYALYISFFPQLVAGPIVKASEFLPQLKETRRVTLKGCERGLQIFLFGMFKKLVLADNLTVFVDEVFTTPTAFHTLTVILAVISYAIQIYMDFSGYSDMAIGCAECMGYSLSKNFNMPYISQNVSEFWKRWHISLSAWLQQYLYIPLGGNRKGKIRTYLNLFITMVLGGLWHGANWTFVIWGALHGFALCIHKRFQKKGKQKNWLISIISIIMTNIFVYFCWIFFRASDFQNAWLVIRRLIGVHDGIIHIYTWSIIAIIITVVATTLGYVRSKKLKKDGIIEGFYPVLSLNTITGLLWVFIEICLIIGLAYVKSSPFIYFQF